MCGSGVRGLQGPNGTLLTGKAGGGEGLTTAAQQREPAASRGTFAESKLRTATVGRARSDLRRSRRERSFLSALQSFFRPERNLSTFSCAILEMLS